MWELDYKESWALKNWCFWIVVLEKTLESPLDCKEIQPVHPKWDQPWVFIERTDVEAEAPILWSPDMERWLIWKRPWCWEGLRAEGEGDDRGWDSWMASPTQWTWVWVDSRSWWWTGMPGVLWFMGLQRVGHDWVTELNWTDPFSVLGSNPGYHTIFRNFLFSREKKKRAPKLTTDEMRNWIWTHWLRWTCQWWIKNKSEVKCLFSMSPYWAPHIYVTLLTYIFI